MNRRWFMGLFGASAVATVLPGKAVAGDAYEVKKTYVDGFRGPIATEIGDAPAKDYGPVTEASVRAELEDRHFIAIPSRKSLLRTPELTEKREFLMQMVYTGQIMVDYSIANPNDETSETCLMFINSRPFIQPKGHKYHVSTGDN